MSEVRTPLPEDVDALKALVQRQAAEHRRELKRRDAELERQRGAIAEREAKIESLHEQLRLLLAQRFGASSERLACDAQLGLFNEAETYAEDDAPEDERVEVPTHTRRRRGRAPLPAHLPRVEIIHDLAHSDKVCPHDGTTLKRFGEATCEQLDIVPAKIRVLLHKRLKYSCPCCRGHVKTAPMTPQPIPKSQASPGLLAYVATSKYADALPLYHLSKMLERIGVTLGRATLSSWMVRAGGLVQPLINLLRDELLDSAYLQCDETTVQVLKEPGKRPESKSYLWCQRGGEPKRTVILFDYDRSRSGEVPRRLLGGFSGYLQTDGYEGYHAVVRENGITWLYCFAHARRRFTDALKALGLNPKKLPDTPPDKARRTLKGLAFIRTLYVIERRLWGTPPEERYRIRQQESPPVLEKLKAWVDDARPKVLPGSPLGEALAYLDKHWEGLVRYCGDGRLEIDNNQVENALRPFVVGRKNWLFSDTVHGAKASANLYSLIETAKANGLEPYAYLRRVFTELPKAKTVESIETLLPYHLDRNTLITGPV